jgi:hypothetical protein
MVSLCKFRKIIMPRSLATMLAFSLLMFLPLAVPVVHGAYNQSCTVIGWNPNYPTQVAPGQGVQVTTTISVSCAQWRTFYSARVDLVDTSSGRLFSTSAFQIGWKPNVTATVSNAAIAPQATGTWNLQLNLYIFEEAGMVGSFKHPLSIVVGTANSSAQQTTTAYSSATSQMAVASNVTSAVNQPAPAAIPSSTPGSRVAYVAVAIAAACVIGILLFVFRRRPRK